MFALLAIHSTELPSRSCMNIISLGIIISESPDGFDLFLKYMILLDEIWTLRNGILHEGKATINLVHKIITRQRLYSKALLYETDHERAQSTNSKGRFQVSFTTGFIPHSKYYTFIDGSFCHNVCSWAFIVYNELNQIIFTDYGVSESSTDAQVAELESLQNALLWANKSDISNFLVLTDCLSLAKLSNGFWGDVYWYNYQVASVCIELLK